MWRFSGLSPLCQVSKEALELTELGAKLRLYRSRLSFCDQFPSRLEASPQSEVLENFFFVFTFHDGVWLFGGEVLGWDAVVDEQLNVIYMLGERILVIFEK